MAIYDPNDPVRNAIRLRVADRITPKDEAEEAAIKDVRAQMLMDRIKQYEQAEDNAEKRWASKSKAIIARYGPGKGTQSTEYAAALKKYQDEVNDWQEAKAAALTMLKQLG